MVVVVMVMVIVVAMVMVVVIVVVMVMVVVDKMEGLLKNSSVTQELDRKRNVLVSFREQNVIHDLVSQSIV